MGDMALDEGKVLALDVARSEHEQLMASVDGADAKAVGILGSAGVVMAASGAVVVLLGSEPAKGSFREEHHAQMRWIRGMRKPCIRNHI